MECNHLAETSGLTKNLRQIRIFFEVVLDGELAVP